MFHQGSADALAKVFVADRIGALDRRPPGFRSGVSGSDAALSVFGAVALIVLILIGPAGAALLGLVGLAAIWPLRGLIERGTREGLRFDERMPEAGDRWRAWRVHEPDAEYLRRGRAA